MSSNLNRSTSAFSKKDESRPSRDGSHCCWQFCRATSAPLMVHLLAYLLLLVWDLKNLAGAFTATHPSRFDRVHRNTLSIHSRRPTQSPESAAFYGRRDVALTARNRVAKQQEQLQERWFPRPVTPADDEDDIYAGSSKGCTRELELKSVKLAARLINQRLQEINDPSQQSANDRLLSSKSDLSLRNYQLAKGRFIDLTCTEQGEQTLENMFLLEDATTEEDAELIQGAIIALQSLLIFGTQVGLKGAPAQLQRMIAHLDSRGDQEKFLMRDLETWDTDSVRRLKYRLNQAPAVQLLDELKWKRTSQGAFDLLVSIGVWDKHEDVPLLRSGFSLRFNEQELAAAEHAANSTRDPDEILGLRKDLRHMKVFTIDSAETSEIDDGISLEEYTAKDGKKKQRIWIHIADAERWAPRSSDLSDIARRRVTSLYLPPGAIPMLPPKASEDLMSLKANTDVCALSMGVELLETGALDLSSIAICPSLIRVTYRLTYNEVDEMLEEGIGYNEEWELGGLLSIATKRRKYRIKNGSAEGFVPNPIPQRTISISKDKNAPDGINIKVDVSVSHNAGKNQTADAEERDSSNILASSLAQPVSSAFVLVTEIMILAGEAMGRWKVVQDQLREGKAINGNENVFWNSLRLPFRTQRKPDYTSRARERHVMNSLAEYNVGGGYCHAWYSRRFLSPVEVVETPAPHSGLGLSAYVQWSSPIRRYSDLLVHISVKRYLRRNALSELIEEGKPLGAYNLISDDLGCPPPKSTGNSEYEWDTTALDEDINFREGAGLVGAARILQRQSEQYWLFEYIRRIQDRDPDYTWEALVLGYVSGDENKKQYAIYIYEIGFEYRYSSLVDLKPGTELKLRVSVITPRTNQLKFVRTNI